MMVVVVVHQEAVRKRSPRTPGLFAGDNFFCRQITVTQSKTVAYLYNCNNDNQHLLSTQYASGIVSCTGHVLVCLVLSMRSRH